MSSVSKKAPDAKGSKCEIVRFVDQNMRAGFFDQRRKEAGPERRLQDGDFAVSVRQWAKRPTLPVGENMFGVNLRRMVDTMIMTAETGQGTRAIVRLAGNTAKADPVQLYRASAE